MNQCQANADFSDDISMTLAQLLPDPYPQVCKHCNNYILPTEVYALTPPPPNSMAEASREHLDCHDTIMLKASSIQPTNTDFTCAGTTTTYATNSPLPLSQFTTNTTAIEYSPTISSQKLVPTSMPSPAMPSPTLLSQETSFNRIEAFKRKHAQITTSSPHTRY